MKRIIERLKELFRNRRTLWRQCRWLVAKAKPCLPRLVLLFVVETVLATVTVGVTLVNKRVIDQAIQASGVFDAPAFALMAALTVGNLLVGAGANYLSMLVREQYAYDLRMQLYGRMLHSKWTALKAYHSGDIQTRLTSDLDAVSSGIAGMVPEVLSLAVRLVLAFAVLFSFDRLLALAALLLGPLGLITGVLFTGRLHKYEIELRENEAKQRSFMQENTENITVMKAFSQEERSMSRFGQLRRERMALVRRRSLFGMLVHVAMRMTFTTGYLLAFGWGILRVSLAQITYGTMNVFLSLINQVQGPIMSLGNIVPRFVGMLAAAGRVMELEDLPAEERSEAPTLTGAVGARLRHASFAYADQKGEHDEVLENVSLDVRPGEAVALIGRTGSGKTTIARLLLNLVEPTSGECCFYDASGRTAKASPATRSLIAYVPQGNTMTSGTIRENLTLGENIADEALRQALSTAEAEFALELGLDAHIGERGVGLSEGQAQRLAIARALLRKAPFLILDEASASLDMETERRIMENLRAARSGVTCLVITHRPSLLAICDRCYRVREGAVEEIADPLAETMVEQP